MTAAKRMTIDADLLAASREYVDKQLKVMGNPALSPQSYDDLVYRCAVEPQKIRNAKKAFAKLLEGEGNRG